MNMLCFKVTDEPFRPLTDEPRPQQLREEDTYQEHNIAHKHGYVEQQSVHWRNVQLGKGCRHLIENHEQTWIRIG